MIKTQLFLLLIMINCQSNLVAQNTSNNSEIYNLEGFWKLDSMSAFKKDTIETIRLLEYYFEYTEDSIKVCSAGNWDNAIYELFKDENDSIKFVRITPEERRESYLLKVNNDQFIFYRTITLSNVPTKTFWYYSRILEEELRERCVEGRRY